MYVDDIVGQYLLKLEVCPGPDCNKLKAQRFCNHCQRPEQCQQCMCDKAPQNKDRTVKCEVCGQMLRPILSEAPVNALLHPDHGEVAFAVHSSPLSTSRVTCWSNLDMKSNLSGLKKQHVIKVK